MANLYEGNFPYTRDIISAWKSSAIGVYLCGYLSTDSTVLYTLYIGRGVSEGGMRARLLDHLREDSWPGVTHFGYYACNSVSEAEELEARLIFQYKPRYNIQGK